MYTTWSLQETPVDEPPADEPPTDKPPADELIIKCDQLPVLRTEEEQKCL